MDAWITPALLNGVGVVGVTLLVGLLVWRGQLIPRATHLEVVNQHKDQAQKAEDRADRWENVALKALDASEKLAEPVAVTAKVLTKLPNPTRDGATS